VCVCVCVVFLRVWVCCDAYVGLAKTVCL